MLRPTIARLGVDMPQRLVESKRERASDADVLLVVFVLRFGFRIRLVDHDLEVEDKDAADRARRGHAPPNRSDRFLQNGLGRGRDERAFRVLAGGARPRVDAPARWKATQ
jgi:hypothetical protein